MDASARSSSQLSIGSFSVVHQSATAGAVVANVLSARANPAGGVAAEPMALGGPA
ncbi:hypothetical protein [Sphingomonas yabuuchiae]|uniref:hypothetical protein n=1 Tax=Sphingomonas yabuuchiae TaxID=172044 RepID=UPI003607DD2B